MCNIKLVIEEEKSGAIEKMAWLTRNALLASLLANVTIMSVSLESDRQREGETICELNLRQ